MTHREGGGQMPAAILFDIDGCLISTGGAGTKAWRHAFDRLHGIPADIGQFTEAGMTDPEVEAAAHIKLARAQLNEFFCFGGYGSDSSDRGALTRVAIERCGRLHGHVMDPARVLVVGDTPRDVEAAHAASAIAVGVATGTYTGEDLRAAGANYVLATLEGALPGVPDASASAMERGSRGSSKERQRL